MSIDKWLTDNLPTKRKREIDEKFNALSEEKVNDLKKQKIKKLLQGKNTKDTASIPEENAFLDQILQFKDWLNRRHYLKGDLDKIETWINNLNAKLALEDRKNKENEPKSKKSHLKDLFKEIPPQFLDEKTRIAINKKINGSPMTSSDRYYLKKLNIEVQDKLIKAKYYENLKKLLD